jgi:hypothetical protein
MINDAMHPADMQLEEIYKCLKYFTEQIIKTDDDYCNGRNIYIKRLSYCTINFILIKIKEAVYTGNAMIIENSIVANESSINITDLRTLMEKLEMSDTNQELPEFVIDVEEIKSRKFDNAMMQFKLLPAMHKAHPLLILHMLYYLRSVKNEQELLDNNQIDLESLTLDEIRAIIDKNITSAFLLISDELFAEEVRTMIRLKMAFDQEIRARQIIISIAEQDMFVGGWIYRKPLIPYTAYKLLTDDSFNPCFLSDDICDDSNLISDMDMTRDDFAYLIPLAKEGNHEAQHELGIKYLTLSHSTYHQTKARYWLKMAAEGGLVKSQVVYANILAYDDNLVTEAFEWYLKAGNGGNAEAQYKLGKAYKVGIGVEQNEEEAKKWFELAANQGHMLAIYNISDAKL